MEKASEISPVVSRRLLLAKEFFLHALDRSLHEDDLEKMIAIHNFHISVEILLKAILIHYDIRTEKILNIDFETMLNEIDNHFKSRKKKLRYRQEMRNLNHMRNLVQHHAMEPASSSMEECRVFSKKFLETAYEEYFYISFDDISRVTFIADSLLMSLLQTAYEAILVKDYETSLRFTALGFEFAATSIARLLPSDGFRSSFDYPSIHVSSMEFNRDFHDFNRGLQRAIEKIYDTIRNSKHFAAILGSGISLGELKRFEAIKPILQLSAGGHPFFYKRHDEKVPTESNAKWANNFVINSILSWQHQGLAPIVPEYWRNACDAFVSGGLPKEENLESEE